METHVSPVVCLYRITSVQHMINKTRLSAACVGDVERAKVTQQTSDAIADIDASFTHSATGHPHISTVDTDGLNIPVQQLYRHELVYHTRDERFSW